MLFSSIEYTFLEGAGKPQDADTSQLMANPLTCFPPTCENHPPSFFQFCAPGVGLGWGLVPMCVVGRRTAGWFGAVCFNLTCQKQSQGRLRRQMNARLA